MADWDQMQIKFKLIAAKAELMSKERLRPWESDIQNAASEIARYARYAREIEQDARESESGDR